MSEKGREKKLLQFEKKTLRKKFAVVSDLSIRYILMDLKENLIVSYYLSSFKKVILCNGDNEPKYKISGTSLAYD